MRTRLAHPSPDELDALIALVEQPDPPRPLSAQEAPRAQFILFLKDNLIRKGKIRGCEVSGLYKFYLDWRERFTPAPDLILPFSFARMVRDHGFRRRRRSHQNGRDQRCLGMNSKTAAWILEWLQLHPLTDADIQIFRPSRRWGHPRGKHES